MLLTRLAYRFPGQEIVRKIGRFEQIADPRNFEGFLISDFYGKTYYGFVDDLGVQEALTMQAPPYVMDYETYIRKSETLRHHFEQQGIEKVVFSRVKQVGMRQEEFDAFFERITKKYPQAFCYWFDSPSLGKWMGATPELLVHFDGNEGKTMALAGTKKVSDNSEWQHKEQHEQALVTDFIKAIVEKHATRITIQERQELVAGPVKHLLNKISFSILSNKQWDFIQRLHPTPAVSGTPREKALNCIAEFEQHDRKFYCGVIGENYRQRKSLYVNLRSAQLIDDQLYLYVGGGFTRASNVAHEWEETERKAQTFIDIMESL